VKRAVIFILLIISSMPLFAQQNSGQENNGNNYQRLDLVREDMELNIESRFMYWFENIESATMTALNPSLALEFVFMKNHSVKVDFGYTMSLLNDYNARNNVFYSPNDINISYDYLKQINNLNLFFGPRLTIPVAVSNEYIAREGVLSAGAGRYMAGLSFAITGIRDPVVWTGEFSYNIGFPKEERFGMSWLPGIMKASFGISDLFNDRFGFSLAVRQDITLPEIENGIPNPDSLLFRSYVHTELFILYEKDYIRLAVNIPAYPIGTPFLISMTYGHRFKSSD